MTMKVRALGVGLTALAMMWLAGCDHYVCSSGATFGNSSCAASGSGVGSGGTTNNISVTTFVYFVDPNAGQMAMEGLNVADSQTYATDSTFVTPSVTVGDNNAMVVVGEKYLYLSSSAQDLYAFSIDATTGALTSISGSPYPVIGESLAADPNGKFLFAGEAAGVHVFTINSDGSLTQISGSPFSNDGLLPTQLVTDGLGKYLYARAGTDITEFSYNQTTGALTQIGTITPGMSMIASEKTGTYILGITGASAEVYTFSIGSTGALTQLSTSPTTLAPIYLAVDPNGTYVYTFNETFVIGASGQPMEGYTLGSNGSLTALSTSPFTGLDASMGLIDQSGEYMFTVALAGSIGEEFAYGINTTTGAVTSTLPSAGAAGNYVVTDAP